ncbi:hypothetical protein [Arthrobacter sp. ISL-28]|uniref:hypothetical protein n=1 Tax=Arthrobacter sp. ISL-28 TaxID=2819108 RepID=UPI001BEC2ECC|nr:hypothetical protein [Arthrobacter sp. ISL-28]MBT2523330.1 hypothetical protein [Arthrobacter sp. ISL-28]
MPHYSSPSVQDELYIAGSSWLKLEDDSGLQLDEAVFEACSAALRNAGIKRHQVALSITSSLDLYDARSISNALTAPAAAGYLNDELRVEGDGAAAFLVAAAGLASGQADIAIVVASSAPEVGYTSEAAVRGLQEHVSSYTFDAHTSRPVGLTANTVLGLHAANRLDVGRVSWAKMVESTAADINRGAASGRAQRAATTIDAVASAPVAMAPLNELMLPASSAGIGAIVIAAGVAGRRCPDPLARVTGWGSAVSPSPGRTSWLTNPAGAAGKAARDAYRRSGRRAEEIGYAEMTDLTPAMTDELAEALQIRHLAASERNRTGGVRSNHPGIANGLLRIIEGAELARERTAGHNALVHAADNLMGLTSSTSSVLILESL